MDYRFTVDIPRIFVFVPSIEILLSNVLLETVNKSIFESNIEFENGNKFDLLSSKIFQIDSKSVIGNCKIPLTG